MTPYVPARHRHLLAALHAEHRYPDASPRPNPTIEEAETTPGVHLFVLEDEGRPVSLIGCTEVEGHALFLHSAYTVPDRRGEGNLGRLLADFEGTAPVGMVLYCAIHRDNVRSLRAFARAGFQIEDANWKEKPGFKMVSKAARSQEARAA